MGSLGETLGHHCDHRYAVKRLPSHPTDIKHATFRCTSARLMAPTHWMRDVNPKAPEIAGALAEELEKTHHKGCPFLLKWRQPTGRVEIRIPAPSL